MTKNFIMSACVVCFFFFIQEEKKIILDAEVNLVQYLGEGYKRIEISPEEIRIADSLVSDYLLTNYQQYSYTQKIDNYYSYYRQYAGYKQSSPERIIFINAFKSKSERVESGLLKNFLYDTKGGGSFYFKIKVNLETNKCFDLWVNAPK